MRTPGAVSWSSSLHTPDRSHGEAEQELWWTETARLLRHARVGLLLMVLADASARLGSIQSSAVGASGAEAPCSAGLHFHKFLVENSDDVTRPA